MKEKNKRKTVGTRYWRERERERLQFRLFSAGGIDPIRCDWINADGDY